MRSLKFLTAAGLVLAGAAGNQDARLFDGSMHAWTQDDSRPVANPAQP
jgi:3-mercaptopyruvate sulfurtransferase SseA